MKKRYTKREQILADIDKEKKRAVDLLTEAEHLEALAVDEFKIPSMIENAVYKKEEAKALRKRSARIMDIKLLKLSSRLAELDTMPMPFLDGTKNYGDESVQKRLPK